jgi:hypothetical protein
MSVIGHLELVIIYTVVHITCGLYLKLVWLMVRFMVFNATFNNISVISWQSVLLTELARENHPHVESH